MKRSKLAGFVSMCHQQFTSTNCIVFTEPESSSRVAAQSTIQMFHQQHQPSVSHCEQKLLQSMLSCHTTSCSSIYSLKLVTVSYKTFYLFSAST